MNHKYLAVAGSIDSAVAVFSRRHDGGLDFLDSYSLGQRSIPSFHRVYNPLPLKSTSPSFMTSYSTSGTTVPQIDLPALATSPFALQNVQGPVLLRHDSSSHISATDAVTMSIHGRQYLAVAQASNAGGGQVSVFHLQRHAQVFPTHLFSRTSYCRLVLSTGTRVRLRELTYH